MNIAEMLDERAAQGGLTSLTLCRVGQGWQVYVRSGHTDSIVAKRGPTPGGTIAEALSDLTWTEDFDRKQGLARINAAPPEIVEPKAAEPAGVFD